MSNGTNWILVVLMGAASTLSCSPVQPGPAASRVSPRASALADLHDDVRVRGLDDRRFDQATYAAW